MWEPGMTDFGINDLKSYTGASGNSLSDFYAKTSSNASTTLPSKGSLPGHLPYATVDSSGAFHESTPGQPIAMSDFRGMTFAIGSIVIRGSYDTYHTNAQCQASIEVTNERGMIDSSRSSNTIYVTTSYNGRVSARCGVYINTEVFMVSYYQYYQTKSISVVVDNNNDSNKSFVAQKQDQPSLGLCAAASHKNGYTKGSTTTLTSDPRPDAKWVYFTIYAINRNT